MSHSRSKKRQAAIVVISYYPTLAGNPLTQLSATTPNLKRLLTRLEHIKDRYATKGILWTAPTPDRTEVYPVFVVDDAPLVYDHLQVWSEHQPADWFTLMWDSFGENGYHCYLVPNLRRSAERQSKITIEHWHLQAKKVTLLFFMHGDTIQSSQTFRPQFLEGRATTKVGFISVSEYATAQPGHIFEVPCRRMRDMTEEERWGLDFNQFIDPTAEPPPAPSWIKPEHLRKETK